MIFIRMWVLVERFILTLRIDLHIKYKILNFWELMFFIIPFKAKTMFGCQENRGWRRKGKTHIQVKRGQGWGFHSDFITRMGKTSYSVSGLWWVWKTIIHRTREWDSDAPSQTCSVAYTNFSDGWTNHCPVSLK